jgi:hypothetical protein
MDTHSTEQPGRLERWREKRRVKRELTGDSPEKAAERHTPKRDWIDRWVWSNGVERHNRF